MFPMFPFLLPRILSFCFFNATFFNLKFLMEMLVLGVLEECVKKKNLQLNLQENENSCFLYVIDVKVLQLFLSIKIT